MTTHDAVGTPGDTAMPVRVRRPERRSAQAIGVITAGMLAEQYRIPHRDTRKKEGYQRPVSTSRVNRLVADLRRGQVDLPTAVLLNIRQFTPGSHLVESDDGMAMFKPNGQPLYVVDGQHRVAALAKLVEENPERWSSYPVPFVCMLGASALEEMEQFYIVNSTAKSVRTDLALDLLKQRAENDPAVREVLMERGEDWKVEAQTLTERLDNTRLWKGRIRFPGEPKAETTIGSAGVASSLKQLLGTPFFSQVSTENRLRILEAYWEGIAMLLPEVFKDPTDYALQKGTGVMIMHSLLVPVIELLRSKGMSLVDPESYEDVLRETLANLEGDTADGEIARGADFWLAGSHGAAGSFSGNAGRRVLTARLRTDLPAVEVE